MIEFSTTLYFDPRYWAIGAGYPEYDGSVGGYPAIGFTLQLLFIGINLTLYQTWMVEDDDDD